MEKCWLIYNSSLQSDNFKQVYNLYIQGGKKFGIEFEMVKNTDIIFYVDKVCKINSSVFTGEPDFILFLDKDIRLAKHLEILGYKVFNSSKSIEQCDDKIITSQLLAKEKIKIPKTIFSHMFFLENNNEKQVFLEFVENELKFPLVVKEAFGSFGEQVYLINNMKELEKINNKLWRKPHLYQEFIKSSYGKDLRVYIVGEKAVGGILRENTQDFRANITLGGKVTPCEIPEKFAKLAISSSKILGTTFAGVDLLYGNNGEPVVCEVNSNAHIKGIFESTGVNVAEYILEEILKQLGGY